MENTSLSRHVALADPLPSEGALQHRQGALAFLRSRNGLLFGAATLGIIAFFAGWRWFGVASVLPLLYVVPCAAMMLMCMRGHGGSANAPTKPDSNAGSRPDAGR